MSAGGRGPDLAAPLRRRQMLGLLAGGLVAAAAGCSLFDSDEEAAEFDGEGQIVFAAPGNSAPVSSAASPSGSGTRGIRPSRLSPSTCRSPPTSSGPT